VDSKEFKSFDEHFPNENPYDAYQKSIDNSLQAKHAAEMLKIQRLCYQVFMLHNEGKELLQELENTFLIKQLWNPLTEHAERMAMYWEGFRDCIRSFRQMIDAHTQFEQRQKGV